MPRTAGSILVFLVLILSAFAPMVIRLQGCKSEQVEGLSIYLGVLSSRGKISVEGRIWRPFNPMTSPLTSFSFILSFNFLLMMFSLNLQLGL